MVTLKVQIGGAALPLQEQITCYLGNAIEGSRMRSPWSVVTLDMTTEQAQELAHNIVTHASEEGS
jgi:hypothetical protein